MSKLHVSKYGQVSNAPILVLLHGWGSSSKIWQLCLTELGKNFQLWCVDLPGHGESHDIVWDESMHQGVELLANTLPPRCLLIGWSLGGLLAQLFAKQYTQRVQGLMLVASTPKFVASNDWPHAMSLSTFQKFVKQYDASPQETLKQFIALQILHGGSLKIIMRELEHASSGQSLEKICWGLEWLLKIDLREAFVSNDLPIVLFHGENDQVSSVQAAEQTAEIWEHAQLCNIPQAGHVPFLSHPEQFIEQIKIMLGQVENKVNAK